MHHTCKEQECLQMELDLTNVVICETHGHEVFGRAVVIHLVTSVNT